MYLCVFFFSITQYIQVIFLIKFLFNLSFLMTPIEKISRAAIGVSLSLFGIKKDIY